MGHTAHDVETQGRLRLCSSTDTSHVNCNMYVLLTKLQAPGQYRPIRYCPRARSITHLLQARLGYQHFFHFCSRSTRIGFKVRSISCNVGPAKRAISQNIDRSRMSGIGKLHDDGHVSCNKDIYLSMSVIILIVN